MAQFVVLASRGFKAIDDSTVRSIAGAMVAAPRVIAPRPDLVILFAHDEWENVPPTTVEGAVGAALLAPHQDIPHPQPNAQNLLAKGYAEEAASLPWPSLAIAWDEHHVRVITDPMGSRSAWVASVPGSTVVASMPSLLLAHPRMVAEPNLAVIGERLAYRPTSQTETVYAGMSLVPPGSCLALPVSQESRIEAWYRWPEDTRVNVSFAQAASEIGQLTHEVMSEQLAHRSSSKCSLHLSGGLDSSSLAGVIHRLGRDETMIAASRTFPGLPTDESQYQAAVLDATRFVAKRTDALDFDLNRDLIEPTRRSRLPVLRHDPAHARASQALAADGRHTGFIGEGGDELYSAINSSLLGLATGGRFSAAVRHLRQKTLRQHASEHLELLPLAIQRRRLRSRPWLRTSFIKDQNIVRRIVGTSEGLSEKARRDSRLLWALGGGWHAVGAETYEFRYTYLQTEEVSVFLHPRLVAQSLRLPDLLRVSSDDSRSLQRSAFADVLPPELQTRRGKVHFDHRHARDLTGGEVRSVLKDMSLAQSGLVDGHSALEAYDDFVRSLSDRSTPLRPLSGPLWSLIGLEVWWRITFGGS